MSTASQPKSQSPEREQNFDSPRARELQLVSHHLDEVPSNSEADPASPALPQGCELVLVAPDVPLDVPALQAVLLPEKPRRRASRGQEEWTPPDGMQMITQERKSGKRKGNKDTYYTLPGVSSKFRSTPKVQRYLQKKSVRSWRKNSGTRPSQPAEAESSSTVLDPQPTVESCLEEPKGQTNDEEREGPKSRPKVCVQWNLFKRSRRHKRKNL